MTHLDPFRPRRTLALPLAERDGWRLKRYAILSDGRSYDVAVAEAALPAALARLPAAGTLDDPRGNHGIGFQIIHFAEQVSAVSPVFYWQWGSVLSNTHQARAEWASPTEFGDGFREIIGCLWELQVVAFETDAWQRLVLGRDGSPQEAVVDYLEAHLSDT